MASIFEVNKGAEGEWVVRFKAPALKGRGVVRRRVQAATKELLLAVGELVDAAVSYLEEPEKGEGKGKKRRIPVQ